MELLFQALDRAAWSNPLPPTALQLKACLKPYHEVEELEFETGLGDDSKRRPPGEGVEMEP